MTNQAIAEIQNVFESAGLPITAAQAEIVYTALRAIAEQSKGDGRITRIMPSQTNA